MIIYYKTNGKIISVIPNDQNITTYYYHYPEHFKNNLESISPEVVPQDLENCRVVNGELVKMSDLEIKEIQQYGKTLTVEERLLNQSRPSSREIQKAETTIEILSLLQEVL